MGEVVKGRRVYPCENGHVISRLTQEGDYGKDSSGRWFARPPKLKHVTGVWLNNPKYSWEVIEHPDGTISVHPSIDCIGTWHGWLKKGVWTGS